jgi:non-ribosomal peptide synthetase component F
MSPSSLLHRRLSIIHGPSLPPLRHLTWGNFLRQQCQERSDDIAVISQHQDQILTYAELHQQSDDLAAGLLEAGVERGDRIAVLLGNRSEYVDVSTAFVEPRKEKLNGCCRYFLHVPKLGLL